MSDETRNAEVRLSADVDPYRRDIQAAAAETDKLSAAVDKLASKLDGITKRAGKKLMLFGGVGVAAGGLAIKEAADYEKKLSTLQATAKVLDKSMGDTTKTIKGLSKEFPIARDEVIALVTTLNTLGVKGKKDIDGIARSMVQLSAATGEGLGTLTTQTVELQKQMGTLQTGTMSQLANSLLVVSKNAGVSASGVLSFAQSIAPAARAADMSQASLLGVSAAFTKAGQDGYAAANTFNTMLADITRQVSTGSPEIAKYANLIGVTADQFRSMDRGQAVAAIFESINKQGPDAIRTLDRLGYDGVRALKSIQAVSQSGGLQDQIAIAMGAYQRESELQSGSKAAMDGFYDELTRTKNTMQDLTTQAGTPLVAFLTSLQKAFNFLLQPVAAVAGGLAEVSASLGSLGAVGAVGLGGVMALSKVNATVGALRTVTGGPWRVLKDGFRAGQGDLVGNAGAESYTAGRMRWWQKMPFLLGEGYGRAVGPGDGPGFMQRFVGPALTSPMKLGTLLFDAQRGFYDNSRLPSYARQAPVLGGLGNVARAMMSPRDFIRGWRSGDASLVTGPAGMARDPEDWAKKVRHGTEAIARHTAVTNTNLSVQRQLAVSTGTLAKAFLKLELAAARSTGSALLAGAGHVGRGLGNAAMGLLGGPIGAALTAATVGGTFLWSNRNQGDVEIGGSAPIDKYNAALGIATSELGTFTDAVRTATRALPKPTDMGDVSTVSSEVVGLARMPKRKMTNDIFENLKFADSRAAMMQLMGVDDPRQVQLIQADLVQARGRGQAQKATDIFMNRVGAGYGVDYGAIVRDINSEQGQGFKGALGYADPTAAKITGAVFESMMGSYGRNAKLYNQGYADQVQINEAGKFLAAALPQGMTFGKDEKRTAVQAVRGFEKAFLGGTKTGFDVGRFALDTRGMSEAEQAEYFFTEHLGKNDNKRVRGWIKSLGKDVDFGGMGLAGLTQMARQEDSAYTASIRGTGTIGNVALNNAAVQRAATNPGDVNAQYQGVTELFNKARGLGDSFAGTDAELQKLKAAIKDPTDELYKLAQAAQSLNQQQRAAAMGYMGREGVLGSSAENFRTTLAGDRNAPDYQERLAASRGELEGQKKGYYDYLVSLIQAHKNYAIQMKRGEQDLHRTIQRSNEDFYRSMKRSAEDAAKSIYDPFSRVQSEYTASAGTLLLNLSDQNERMERQMSQVAKLREMGLSKQAVNTLRLSDADQAQQVDRLFDDLMEDPDLISTMNRRVRKRGKLAKDMVMNENSEQYQRATSDHQRSMDRMLSDYQLSIDRSKEDLARMGDQVFGSFEQIMNRAVRKVRGNLGAMADKTIAEIQRVREENPELFVDLYSPALATAGMSGVGHTTPSPRVAERAVYATPTRGGSSSSTRVDASTNFTGPITVEANDPNQLVREVERKARERKLTRPGSGKQLPGSI